MAFSVITNLQITFVSSSNEYSELGAVVEWKHGDCRRCVSGDPAALGGTDSCSLIIVIMQHAAVYPCISVVMINHPKIILTFITTDSSSQMSSDRCSVCVNTRGLATISSIVAGQKKK